MLFQVVPPGNLLYIDLKSRIIFGFQSGSCKIIAADVAYFTLKICHNYGMSFEIDKRYNEITNAMLLRVY